METSIITVGKSLKWIGDNKYNTLSEEFIVFDIEGHYKKLKT